MYVIVFNLKFMSIDYYKKSNLNYLLNQNNNNINLLKINDKEFNECLKELIPNLNFIFLNFNNYKENSFKNYLEIIYLISLSIDLNEAIPNYLNDLISLLFNLIKKPDSFFKPLFMCLYAISLQNINTINILLSFNYLNFCKLILSSSFSSEIHSLIFNSLSKISNLSINHRDQVIQFFPLNSIQNYILVYSNKEKFTNFVQLICSYTKFPIFNDIELFFKLFYKVLVTPIRNSHEYSLLGILRLLNHNINNIIYLNFLPEILYYFKKTPKESEYICYIIGLISLSNLNPKLYLKPSEISSLINEENFNKFPNLIISSCWCIGLICLNYSFLLNDNDNYNLLIYLLSYFNNSPFNLKEELGFSIISLSNLINGNNLINIVNNKYFNIYFELLLLRSNQTLNLIFDFFLKLINEFQFINNFENLKEIFYSFDIKYYLNEINLNDPNLRGKIEKFNLEFRLEQFN